MGKLETGEKAIAAHLKIGLLLQAGCCIAQNFAEGTKYIKMAANAGLPKAMNYYGISLEKGLGVSQDGKEALSWYKKGANLGTLMLYLTTEDAMLRVLVRLKIRQASRKGNVDGECSMARCYERYWH